MTTETGNEPTETGAPAVSVEIVTGTRRPLPSSVTQAVVPLGVMARAQGTTPVPVGSRAKVSTDPEDTVTSLTCPVPESVTKRWLPSGVMANAEGSVPAPSVIGDPTVSSARSMGTTLPPE